MEARGRLDTWAVLWPAPSASLKELMARLGHSRTRAAMIYQHATRDRDQAIAKALGGLMHQVRPIVLIRSAKPLGVRRVARLWPAWPGRAH